MISQGGGMTHQQLLFAHLVHNKDHLGCNLRALNLLWHLEGSRGFVAVPGCVQRISLSFSTSVILKGWSHSAFALKSLFNTIPFKTVTDADCSCSLSSKTLVVEVCCVQISVIEGTLFSRNYSTNHLFPLCWLCRAVVGMPWDRTPTAGQGEREQIPPFLL